MSPQDRQLGERCGQGRKSQGEEENSAGTAAYDAVVGSCVVQQGASGILRSTVSLVGQTGTLE